MAEWIDSFAQSPEAGQARLEALAPSPIRDLLILGLIDASPQLATSLCALVTDASTRSYCDDQSKRPHLFTPHPGGDVAPGSARLTARAQEPLQNYRASWRDLAPDPGPCAEGQAYSSCLQERASSLARKGRTDQAAQACLAIQKAQARQDCFFRAAEQLFLERADFPGAIDLCAGAGEFRFECVSHTHNALGEACRRERPSATAQQVARQLRVVETFWERTEPSTLPCARSCFLFSATDGLVGPHGLDQAVAKTLTEEALAQVRNHVAMRAAPMADPFGEAEKAMRGEADELPPLQNELYRWEVSLAQDSPMPTVAMGSGLRFRPASPDPQRDLQLAVSFALADLHQGPADKLQRATLLSDEERQWFAAQQR